MLLWNGGCHVHEQFSIEKIVEFKNHNAPPRCPSLGRGTSAAEGVRETQQWVFSLGEHTGSPVRLLLDFVQLIE